MKTNTIHCGECGEKMRQHLPDNSIDLTVTSPPYDDLRSYNGYTFEFEPIATELWRVTKPGGVVVWVVADATINGSETGTSFKQALGFMGLGFNLHDTMIWAKDGSPFPEKTRYKNAFEYMFIFCKGKMNIFNPIEDRRNVKNGQKITATDRQSNGETLKSWGRKHSQVYKQFGPRYNVWNQQSEKTPLRATHPAIFPEALARDHIISWSNPGDIVLDPMVGSGTVPKMAVEQGRQYIGIDISQEYVNLATKRVSGARVPLPSLYPARSTNKKIQPDQLPLQLQLSGLDEQEK